MDIINQTEGDNNINYMAGLSANLNDGIVGSVNFSSSSPEWSKVYFEEGLIIDCPLVRYGKNFERIVLPWDSIPHLTSLEKEIIGVRRDFNINNGISFIWTDGHLRKSIAFATDYESKDFYNEIMTNKDIFKIIRNVERRLF